MRLAIGGPTRCDVPAAFAVDAAHLFAYTREMGPWGKNVSMHYVPSTYIHVGREWFLEASIKQGATHVLWLDSDMSVPRELAVLLAMHELPIVACNYRVRQGDGFTASRDGADVPTLATSAGLEAVDYVGLGACFMRADIVAGLGRPWFRHGLNDLGGDVGEDVMFCRGLTRAGFTVWIDHDLSKQVGHIGQITHRCGTAADAVPVG